MTTLSGSNGTVMPETQAPLVLHKESGLPVCQDRLVKVVYHIGSLYASWHNFTKIRRQFCEKFKHAMPGATDEYSGKVRTVLNIEQLVKHSTWQELEWVLGRITLTAEFFQ